MPIRGSSSLLPQHHAFAHRPHAPKTPLNPHKATTPMLYQHCDGKAVMRSAYFKYRSKKDVTTCGLSIK